MSWRKILSLSQKKRIRAWAVKLFSAHSRGYSFELLQNKTTKLCLPHVICAVIAVLSRALYAFTSGWQEFNKTSILHFKNINFVYYDVTLIPIGLGLKKIYPSPPSPLFPPKKRLFFTSTVRPEGVFNI